MKPVIFIGPTISRDDALAQLDAIYLPPVAQGDVYRAATRRPPAIGIIDGYFDRVPAVWHKEILWAMAQSIHVFGSASMGALRAAELAPFGMIGAGWVFESYASGELEDDDEVAVAHAPAQDGYRNLSEAMVNIRRTLATAVDSGVVTPATGELMVAIAKEHFYPERSYRAILTVAARRGVDPAELEALQTWLVHARVDQKRLDALTMLRVMRAHLDPAPPPKDVSYTFIHTDLWEQATRRAGEQGLDAGDQALFGDDLLDEVRLDVGEYPRIVDAAIARVLLGAESRRQGFEVDEDALQAAVTHFRLERDLLEPDELDEWMQDNQLDRRAFIALLIDEARVQWARSALSARVVREIIDQLRLSGDYARFASRARAKRALLDDMLIGAVEPEHIGQSDDALIRKYAAEWSLPAAVTGAAELARELGFDDKDQLLRALRLEELYRSRSRHHDHAGASRRPDDPDA